MPRNSESHPLYIDQIDVANGAVGLTICPGKKGPSIYGGDWERDLATDIKTVAAWKPEYVLTLIEQHEMETLGVTALPEALRKTVPNWVHLPIRDLDAPDQSFEARWRDLSPRLHHCLERGGRVLVHCRGGVGRAGTVAALILLERSGTPQEVIARVRHARHGAVETKAQQRWLRHQGLDSAARRVQAALLTGAMGDSLGAEIEFWSLAKIRHAFPSGLMALPPHQRLRGAITDDTQMTLFTAEGLIRALGGPAGSSGAEIAAEVHRALWRWYATQNGGRERGQWPDDGLAADPRLHKARAPGMTCLGALGSGGAAGTPARNDSKG